MKNSWIRTFRRLAATCAVAGSAAYSSAVCYAAIALDNASDPVYADGWQGTTHDAAGNQLTAGDNGGFGFTAWNFDSGYVASGNYGKPFGYHYGNYADLTIKDIHAGGGFNNIGQSWRLGLGPNSGTNRAGRGFSLGIGETLKVVIDNPTDRQFFKGYFIRLNGGSGGVNGNICQSQNQACTFGGTPVPKSVIGTFEYGTNGAWFVDDGSSGSPGVVDTDTAAAGALISVKRTGADTYDLRMDSLGAGADYSASRTFSNPGANVDWIEFTFFNTLTDSTKATDFYIRSMQIVPEPGTATLLLLGAGSALLGTARRRQDG